MDKPDFIQIASNDESILRQDTFSGFVMGCEHVWSSHVEPLQKENKDLTHQLMERTESREEWKGIALRATSEITRLKEENEALKKGLASVKTADEWKKSEPVEKTN